MAPSVEISIPATTTSTDQGSKPFTLYTITIRQPLRSYNVPKRFSDFVQLHSTLTTQAGKAPPAPLPKKSWIKSTVNSPQLTEARREGLQAYLRAINSEPDPTWRQTEAWRLFLNLPNTEAKSAVTGASGPRHTDLEAAIVDPNVWLDVHRELKGQLNEARQALRKKEAATSPQAQHEASAEVKRWLVRTGTVIIALDAGLSASSGTGNNKSSNDSTNLTVKSQQLGEGEIRRRKDLLSAARKDRDSLERLLNSHASKGSGSGSPADPTDPSSAQMRNNQPQMLSSAGRTQSASALPSKRVFGGPLKETEQTRQLNNTEVLQLQQDIMQAQDEDVTELTKVVRRIKEMGIQINDELVVQNEMLGVIENDIDRVHGKINIAKKRVDQIK